MLGECNIYDQGLGMVKNRKLPNLLTLVLGKNRWELEQNRITAAGIKQLLSTDLPKLRYLNLSKNPLRKTKIGLEKKE